ncbi:alpha/beta hydrolase [Tabrizicola sp.]|uniref:alpha/beta hydrolase n=1 Tax=Tabrizicola sp. TaxID=2005166 RepID=UPI003F2F893F
MTTLYLLSTAALFLFQRQLIYYPARNAPSPVEAGFDGVTEHALTAADGTRVVLWYAPAEPGAATILYFQGKGGEIADRPKRWAAYRAAGLGVAFLSYRGYGGSDGSPTEAGLHQDADAALDWLLAQGIPANQIAVVGESLGTGVATRLAADREVGALILEAPYTSLADVAARRFPWVPARLLILDPFPSLDHISAVEEPLLVLHGTADTRVPTAMGQALHDAAPGPKEIRLFPGVGHVDLFGPTIWAEEIRFLRAHLPS